MTPQEIEDLAFAHMPEAFFRGALQAVFQAHDVARKDCLAAFAGTEAQNVVGYYRRGKLEGYLRDVAGLHPGLTTTVSKAVNSGWNHTEVIAGPVVLTENSVQSPCAMVEKAEFRLTLAESSQLSLWEEPRSEDASLYALLLHSKYSGPESRKFGHLPGSAYLAFPAKDLESYVHEIDLFERYPDIVRAHLPSEWDHDAEVRYFQRARKVRTA